MRKINLFVTALFLLIAVGLHAQNQKVKQVFIANGGEYEFSTPYNDHATIGAFDPADTSYSVFDTVYVESIQDLHLSGEHLFLAAQDSVISYNSSTYQRNGVLSYPGVRSVSVSGNRLFVAKYYGSGAFLHAYDTSGLAVVDSFPQVDQPVYNTVKVGDTIYAGYNLKSKVDQFPPYGVYADSIGKIGVIDANTLNYVRTIQLDTNGAGIRKLFVKGDTLYAACAESGNLLAYHTQSGNRNFYQTGVSSVTAIDGNVLYANFNNTGIGAFDLVSNQITDTTLVQSTSYAASAYNGVKDVFYLTRTDYSSYGRTKRYDITGAVVDSFEVEIAPEAMAVQYQSTVGFHTVKAVPGTLHIYPNPARNILFLNTEGFTSGARVAVYDITGQQLIRKNNPGRELNISSLSEGIYMLEIKEKESRVVRKFIKQ